MTEEPRRDRTRPPDVDGEPDRDDPPRPMSLSEAGRRGGERRRERLGSAGYAELGRKGGEAVKRLYGPEHYRKIGREGGRKRVEQSRLAAERAGGRRGPWDRAAGGEETAPRSLTQIPDRVLRESLPRREYLVEEHEGEGGPAGEDELVEG